MSSEQAESACPTPSWGERASPSLDPESAANPVMDRVNMLRRQLAGLVTLDAEQKTGIPWGCRELDDFMPGGALRPGMIVELLYAQRGGGAGSLALHGAKQAVDHLQAPLVVVDRGQCFYPPAAVARGIESRDLIVVRPPGMSAAEEIWALDQALRCSGVAVVLAWIDKIDAHAYRRLQLAAEAGQTLALLLRPQRVQAYPTWADVQLLISPRPGIAVDKSAPHKGAAALGDRTPGRVHAMRRQAGNGKGTIPGSGNSLENRLFQVTLLRQRGRAGSHTVEGSRLDLEIDEQQNTLQVCAGTVRNEARTMHMAPRVAHPAARRRSAGA